MKPGVFYEALTKSVFGTKGPHKSEALPAPKGGAITAQTEELRSTDDSSAHWPLEDDGT